MIVVAALLVVVVLLFVVVALLFVVVCWCVSSLLSLSGWQL